MPADLSLRLDKRSPVISYPPRIGPLDPAWRDAATFVRVTPEPVIDGDEVGLRYRFQLPGNVLNAVRNYSEEMIAAAERAIGSAATGNIPNVVRVLLNDTKSLTRDKSFTIGYKFVADLTPAKGIERLGVKRILDLAHDTKEADASYRVFTEVDTTRLPALRGSIPKTDDASQFSRPDFLRLSGDGRPVEIIEEVSVKIELAGIADHAFDHVQQAADAIRDFFANESDETSRLARALVLLNGLKDTLVDFFKDKEASVVLNSYIIQLRTVSEEDAAKLRAALEAAITALEGAALGLDGAYEALGYEFENPLYAHADDLRDLVQRLD